jgi:uncharacterized membrane protein YdcZ (DUF606 family)
MDRSIKAGVCGFLLAVVINLFSPIYLDFIPSFLVAILAIYIFRLGTLKDGLVAAFMTYIFTDGILGTIVLATSYFANQPYGPFNIDVWTMFSPIVSAVTAVIAGYIGVWLAQKRKPARELPAPIPPQLPPV